MLETHVIHDPIHNNHKLCLKPESPRKRLNSGRSAKEEGGSGGGGGNKINLTFF
jgi:hypothetical protein